MSLAASGVDPKRIVFELTETAVMQNIGSASDNLRRIRALGIGVALDDFGVGQSNLGQIHRLPITKIKIDRSFIEDLCDSSVSRNIVKTLLDLARNLNCACIVEGVETDEQAMILTALGVTLMQGYLFGRPMAQIAAQERLDRENRENTAA
jgi:EAL domain-containing protein (putative c-di-GMP-specific phosphodiesterase class I)